MTGPLNPIRPDGPLSWYSALGVGPGHFPPLGTAQRFIGGPFDGDTKAVPPDLSTIRLMPPPLGNDPFTVGGTLSSRVPDYVIYSRYELIHQPGPEAEGPVGIEWVWMTDRAYAVATGPRP